jgi:peptidoglycan/xylan/chitin deacetylase (PgdA/CDA1 family)
VSAPLLPRSSGAQQRAATGIHSTGLYDDSLIFERKPYKWPGGKTIAVWIIPNVEIWSFDSAADAETAPTAGEGPDVINYATRDYGIHVGLSRIADVLDAAGIRATAALNSAVCEVYPKAIDEMTKRHWEFVGHGVNNSSSLSKLAPDEERPTLKLALETIQKSTGKKVQGWISPGEIETASTLDLLAEFGVSYTGDWNNDDQPYRMKVKNGTMYSLPYCPIIDDTNLYTASGFTGEQYYQSVVDQFDVLAAESVQQPRVMGLAVHPYLVGQPQRIRYFQRAVQHITQSDQVWLATGSEIVEAYRKVGI